MNPTNIVPGSTDFYQRELNRGPDVEPGAGRSKSQDRRMAIQLNNLTGCEQDVILRRLMREHYGQEPSPGAVFIMGLVRDDMEREATAAVSGQWGNAPGLVDRATEEVNE
jgi:hypothetical protein